MATEHHPIRTGIIIVVGGGLILAGVLSVIDKLPAIVGTIVGAIAEGVSYVFGVLGTPLGLPMWLLSIVFSLVVISTKRRWVVIWTNQRTVWAKERAKEAEEKRIATTELINEMTKTIFGTKEPELDDVEAVGDEAEDYDNEEGEAWKTYLSDTILGIDWRWRWHGTSIESLTALCPECELELNTLTSPMDETGVMTGEQWLNGFACLDTDCGWGIDFSRDDRFETLRLLNEYVKKHIRREARTLGLPI